jgi:hypothetical protein
MKRTIKLFGIAAIVAVIGTILAGCASMQLVSIDNESVTGPRQVRQGSDIDPKDITVMGVYKDGSKKAVNVKSEQIVFDTHKSGPQTVKIRISKNEASFQTQVMPLLSLSIASQPTAKFFTGEPLDRKWPGLEIQGTWEQMGSGKIDTASCEITGFSLEKAGDQTITVSFEGKTAAFSINVAQAHPLNGRWYETDFPGEAFCKFDNLGNYEMGNAKSNTVHARGTYTTSGGKITMTNAIVVGSDYPQFNCFPTMRYERKEMELAIKISEVGKTMTPEQIEKTLDGMYSSGAMDYSIEGDILTFGPYGQYRKR